VTFTVRLALPADYAEAGLVTAQGYHADDLLRRPDGLIDGDYGAQLTDAGRRAREADLLVAVDGPRPKPHVHLWAFRLVLADQP